MPGLTGANRGEQLPKITVVAPWSAEKVHSGSRMICAS
jgi:hypothetical protein